MIGKVEPVSLTSEMQKSYLDYAMSVIVSRALPDVRDGLKPVQRRIVYAMHQMGYHHSGRFQKCASVTGETMKNYHPHGNIPIYDSLVRMAQNFTMRYMLIDPQGNFGCFTKDTKIKLTDGRSLSFEDLIKEQKRGKQHWTFSFNHKTQKIEVTEIKNPRLTKKNVQLVEVQLEDGKKIKCTPDHKFMLRNGSYKKAADLKLRDSLMPAYFNTEQIKVRNGHLRYLSILQPFIHHYEFVHKLADEYNARNGLNKPLNKGYLLHHKDFNRWNNSPDNIIRLTWDEHYKVHYDQVKNLWKEKGDKFRNKHKAALKQVFSNQIIREKLSIRMRQLWQSPEYRAKYPQEFFSKIAKILWENPKTKEFHRIKISKQRLDPKFIQGQSKAVHSSNLRRISSNPNMIREMTDEAIFALRKKWQDPHYAKRVVKNRILSSTSYLLSIYPNLTREIYENTRAERHLPKVETVMKYFGNFDNLLNEARRYNHKVASVRFLDETEDVYDLTINTLHNFLLDVGVFVHNSIDGDSAAAERYTECRLSAISEELLRDINKATVDFVDNYAGTTKEPILLPSVLPNLLLNGASGIAVGMATQIPPHNLGEVTEALIYMIEHPIKEAESGKRKAEEQVPGLGQTREEYHDPNIFTSEATVEDLMKFIKGPDFPTGASIYDQSEILAAYATGKGRVVMRAKADIEESRGGRFDIIVTELPYQVNKAVLIAKIADLVKDKKIEGISDLRDESDRKGMRVVIELKRDAKPQSVLNNLFKHTTMQSVFNVNMVALSDGVPHLMTLKRVLGEFIHHRQTVITRRTKFELTEAKNREHILEGLKIAVDNIDEVINTIRKSKDSEEAKLNLIKRFKLSEIQATAILDMQLRRLAALERQKIEDELKMVRELIAYLEDLLAHPEKILKVIKEELNKIRDRYGDARKTRVYKQKVGEFSEEDLVADEVTIVTVTENGYIKRQAPASFRTQARGGKGVSGITTKEEDAVSHIFYTKTLDNLLFFTDKGRVFQTKVWEIPEASRTAKGQAIVNLINVEQGEKVTAILTTRAKDTTKFLFMGTRQGNVKKTPVAEYANIRKNGLVSIKLDSGDTLCWVTPTRGGDDIILVSRMGQSIRFPEAQVRPTHRDTSGVRGITLHKSDEVVSMNMVDNENIDLLVVMENGLGKKTKVSSWKKQGRGGGGILAAQVTEKTGKIVTAQVVDKDDDTLVLTSNKGQLIKINLRDVPTLQRQTQGVILMRIRPGEKIAAVTVVSSKQKNGENLDKDV